MIDLDSSALAKRYADEPGSDQVRAMVAQGGITTTILSYAEVCSGLNRKLREGAIDSARYRAAAERLDHDWTRIEVLSLSDQVLRRARTLLERHPLRAGDAVQLASALLLRVVTRVDFASADRRLNRAARTEGLGLLL